MLAQTLSCTVLQVENNLHMFLNLAVMYFVLIIAEWELPIQLSSASWSMAGDNSLLVYNFKSYKS